MPGIEACSFRSTYFQYITDSMWKPGPRNDESPNKLIFVTEGVLYFEIQGIRYTVKPGECIFLPQGVVSCGYRPSAMPTGRFSVDFNTPRTAPSPAHFSVRDPQPVRELFTQLIKTAYRADFPQAGLDAMLHTLFYLLRYPPGDLRPNAEEPLAESIKGYVQNAIVRNPTVNSVAAHFGLCPDHVNRVFSRAEHMSLKAYITQLKIRRIEEYFISPNISAQAVAEKLNFPTISALSKFYKYHTGRTLEEYRAQFVREVERK